MRQFDGCDWWSQNDTDIAKAAELAAQSDIAIVAVGTRSIWLGRDAKSKKVTSGEGFDLSSLDLPGRQLDLLKAVKATGKPMIVVLITGKRAGKEVVQVYVRDNFSSVNTPIQQLKAFKKINLEPGQEKEVEFSIPVDELALYNERLQRIVEPGEFEIQVGAASDDIKFRRTIHVK